MQRGGAKLSLLDMIMIVVCVVVRFVDSNRCVLKITLMILLLAFKRSRTYAYEMSRYFYDHTGVIFRIKVRYDTSTDKIQNRKRKPSLKRGDHDRDRERGANRLLALKCIHLQYCNNHSFQIGRRRNRVLIVECKNCLQDWSLQKIGTDRTCN